MQLSTSYNPDSIGTACCAFSSGVEEFTYTGTPHYGQSPYRCTPCQGSLKERGWFDRSQASSKIQAKVVTAVSTI